MLRYRIWFFLVWGTVWGNNVVSLDGTFKDVFENKPGCIVPHTDPLRYMVFNAFDGDVSTAVVVNILYKHFLDSVKGPYFDIQLKNFITIDEVRIVNGYQKNMELYFKNSRAKDIKFYFIDYSRPSNSFPYTERGEKEFTLKDTTNVQVIKISPAVTFNGMTVHILSTYPGTTYDDTCISEIEFWYRGQKYEVANLEEAKREFVRKRKERVLKILLGGPERREGYSFNWMCGLSYITFTRTVKERGEFFIQACVDSRGAFVTNWEQAPDGAEMIITNIRGEWRFDEEGIFWTRVKGKDWKATDVSYIGENDLGRQGVIYFRGSDIETGYFNWSGPDSDAGP
ncbi:hypothetical protein BREVNS_1705 [Brevinematales bacterium NS]|nr:hypothetical protein BREVNS_1705 [Brevinematales bacterium NS]